MSRDYQLINAQIVSRAGVPLVTLAVKSDQGSITFDRTWSPYVQATVVCAPPTAADLTKIDPRAGVRFLANWRQIDLETGAVVNRPLNLSVRARTRAYVVGDGEVLTLTLASDESLAQDWASENGLGPGNGLSTSYCVTYALGQVWENEPGQGTFTIETGAADPTVSADASWVPGTAAWDYMAGLVEVAGAWLYCDEVRGWHYAPPLFTADTTTHAITDTDHIVDVQDVIDRADPTFGNYAVVSYLDSTSSTGNTYVGAGPVVVPRKTLVVARNRKKPSTGNAATGIRASAIKRGRSLTVNALAEIAARPNQTWATTFQGVAWTGALQGVTFDFTTGLMSMKLNVNES